MLLDVKRGDIGSTMAAYAQAYLGEGSPLAADAVTVSPYLGFGSLDPALDLAERSGRGVFVLALTSNKEGPQVQRARDGNGVSVAQTIVDEAAARNAGASPLGPVGLVIGATVGQTELDLSKLNGDDPRAGFRRPGRRCSRPARRCSATNLQHVLPTSSRDILRHGPDVTALRAAALRVRDSIAG